MIYLVYIEIMEFAMSGYANTYIKNIARRKLELMLSNNKSGYYKNWRYLPQMIEVYDKDNINIFKYIIPSYGNNDDDAINNTTTSISYILIKELFSTITNDISLYKIMSMTIGYYTFLFNKEDYDIVKHHNTLLAIIWLYHFELYLKYIDRNLASKYSETYPGIWYRYSDTYASNNNLSIIPIGIKDLYDEAYIHYNDLKYIDYNKKAYNALPIQFDYFYMCNFSTL